MGVKKLNIFSNFLQQNYNHVSLIYYYVLTMNKTFSWITQLVSVFIQYIPDSFVYLCDFHREQAWERWVSATNNGVLAQKHVVLKLLRPLANDKTFDDFEVARNYLQVFTSLLFK